MWCGNACFWAQVSSKYGSWYSERVILQFMSVGYLTGVTYLCYTVLTSSNKSETAVHCCDSALSVPVMLVSRNVFHVISASQFIVFIPFFWLIRSLVDPTLAALILCGPLQLHLVSHFWRAFFSLVLQCGGRLIIWTEPKNIFTSTCPNT